MPGTASDRIASAKDFIEQVDLPKAPTQVRDFGAAPSEFVPDPDKEQSLVAGSEVIAFTKGVTAERRKAITHSALFAQLVANRKVTDENDMEAWYKAYFGALTNVGWAVQSTDFITYEATSAQADVHQAVLQIASGVLGQASAGYLLVKASLDALKNLDQGSPWITVFRRESQKSRSSRFQVGLATEDPQGGFLVKLLAFRLDASTANTQVLFFRFKAEHAALYKFSGSVTIDEGVLGSVGPTLEQRIGAYVRSYIVSVPI
jgi:hypothetical protein